MAHPFKSESDKFKAKGKRGGYAEGGNVVTIPFSPFKTADAIERLKSSGIGNAQQARDFLRVKLRNLDLLRPGETAPDWKRRGGAVRRGK